MTSRQAGRRIGTIAAEHRNPKRRGGARQSAGSRKSAPLSPKDQRRLVQLVACGAIFVLLVAVKLLLPGKMDTLNARLSGLLRQNMDVQAVFSAVGEAVTGEQDVGGSLREVYQAVFQPQEDGEAVETAASAGPALSLETPTALEALTAFRPAGDGERSEETAEEDPAEAETAAAEARGGTAEDFQTAQVSTLAYVLYSASNLPENVNLEQALLGFDYCTPVMGTLSSGFGYREHPVEGEERFHYGIDIAADTGTAIGCFADGTITAVGDSSSYGKYLIVEHEGGFSTLYAHCSRIVASSGQTVREGDTIAEVGQTGVATGPHLHFELHQGDRYLNPIYYVALA